MTLALLFFFAAYGASCFVLGLAVGRRWLVIIPDDISEEPDR